MTAADVTNAQCDPALPQLTVLSEEGWTDAVRSFLDGRKDSLQLLDALVAGRHRAWRGFLDIRADSRVLCIGAGYGALAESLAQHCKQLCVVDPLTARLKFLEQRRAIFAPEADIELVQAGARGRLPFDDGRFDAVVLAEPELVDDPAAFAGELRRLLRAQGQLFLIADNRFSLALPRGPWDRWPGPLAGLARGAALAARWWRGDNGARSLAGLRRGLAFTGFGHLAAYGLWPARQQFDEILPLREGHRVSGQSGARSWKQRLKRRSFFLPAYCVVAQAGGDRRCSTYDRIFAAAAGQLTGDPAALPLQAWRHIMTRKDKMVVQARQAENEVILRIPFAAAAAEAEARHASALQRLERTHPGLAPRLLAEGSVDGIGYRVETALPGQPLRRALAQHGPKEALVRVEGLLETMNPSAALRVAPLAEDSYARLVEARLQRLDPFVRDRERRGRLRNYFRERLYGLPLPFGLVHGDFSASNIYLAGEAAGMVDWEAADFDDLPILDAIGYLESALRPMFPRRSLAESFHALAQWNLPEGLEERFLVARYEKLGIDRRYHSALVYLRWLRQIDHLVPYWLRYDPRGQDRYIHEVIHTLLRG